MNKKKSSGDMEEIGGVRCTTSVKYLGVKVTVDKKE
jgi:hypothetical protein